LPFHKYIDSTEGIILTQHANLSSRSLLVIALDSKIPEVVIYTIEYIIIHHDLGEIN
jgi:hypothetical protein